MSIVAKTLLKRRWHFFHEWVVNEELSNGFTTYSECSKCGSRKAEQPGGCYQPIDWEWVCLKDVNKKFSR